MSNYLKIFERIIVTSLILMMAITIVLITIELGWLIIKEINLSGTAFIMILLGVGFLVAEVAWERILWIRIKISRPKKGGQLW